MGNNNQTTNNNNAGDAILWESADSLIRIRRRVSSAGRWPQHSAPIVTLDVLPRRGTRVRFIQSESESDRVDICLEHAAAQALILALRDADPSVPYSTPESVPGKPVERKLKWDRINAERWAKRRQSGNSD